MSLVVPGPGVAGSTSVTFDAVKVVAAVGEEVLGEDRELIVDMEVVVAVATVRKVLGLMFEVRRVAAAAVVGRRSRMMLGLLEGVILLGWSFGRCAKERIGMTAVSSGAMIGGVEEAFVSRAEAKVLRVVVAADIAAVVLGIEMGIAESEFERRKLPVLAGCIVTSCSYLGTVRGMVLVRSVPVGIQSNHLASEAAVHSCQIVVRCQSSSFPCRPGGSSEQDLS
jgi:hypothetical protein